MSYGAMKSRSSNSQTARAAHGGRVYEAARRWEIEPHEVLDFSASINPLGPPQAVLDAIQNALTPTSVRVYPDTHNFVSAIAEKHRLMLTFRIRGAAASEVNDCLRIMAAAKNQRQSQAGRRHEALVC